MITYLNKQNVYFLNQQRFMWIPFSYKGHENKHVPGFPSLKKMGQHTRNKTIRKKEKNNVFSTFPFLFRLHAKKSPC